MIELATQICVGWLILSMPAAVIVWWRLRGMRDVESGNIRNRDDHVIPAGNAGGGDRAEVGAT